MCGGNKKCKSNLERNKTWKKQETGADTSCIQSPSGNLKRVIVYGCWGKQAKTEDSGLGGRKAMSGESFIQVLVSYSVLWGDKIQPKPDVVVLTRSR